MNFKEKLRRIRTKYRIFLYRGDKYVCPFCGNKSKSFLKIGLPHPAIIENKIIGAGVRRGGCVKCESVDRDRLLFALFDQELKIFSDNPKFSILHAAPEKMVSNEFLKFKYKEYICIDKFMPGYSYPDYTVDMDLLNLNFQSNYFDLVICNHVLEHIDDDIAAMKELFRVLKPGGKAILQVPVASNLAVTYQNDNVQSDKERELHYGQYDHVRIYGQDYTERLESIGFQVQRINISEKYSSYGLIPEEDLFIGIKPAN